jgi:hypothetical protein
MKGRIKPDHIPVNKYELLFIGMPPLTVIKMSGLEKELETVDLPDRTTASGGQTKQLEFTMEMPQHHVVEQAAMELWFKESQDPVSPNYKKNGTLVGTSLSDAIVVSKSILAAFPSKPKYPDMDMSNEGEMAVVEWTMKCDDVLPV